METIETPSYEPVTLVDEKALAGEAAVYKFATQQGYRPQAIACGLTELSVTVDRVHDAPIFDTDSRVVDLLGLRRRLNGWLFDPSRRGLFLAGYPLEARDQTLRSLIDVCMHFSPFDSNDTNLLPDGDDPNTPPAPPALECVPYKGRNYVIATRAGVERFAIDLLGAAPYRRFRKFDIVSMLVRREVPHHGSDIERLEQGRYVTRSMPRGMCFDVVNSDEKPGFAKCTEAYGTTPARLNRLLTRYGGGGRYKGEVADVRRFDASDLMVGRLFVRALVAGGQIDMVSLKPTEELNRQIGCL